MLSIFVVEEVDPVGQGGAHREQIDQPAAHAELAGRYHLGDVGVAADIIWLRRPLTSSLSPCLRKEGVGRQESRRASRYRAVDAGTRAMSASPR